MNFTKISELKNFFSDKKFNKIFLITGKNSYTKSGAYQIFDRILKNLNTFKYFKKNWIPEYSELKIIINELHNFKPDLILAVGGGTVIDYAKSANCLENDVKAEDIKNGKLKYKKKTLLCAIPTTAGSGAEVTENAVLYIDKIKYSVENIKLKPDYFFLIPDLIINSHFKLKASCGFDAIAQGIESILSLKSNSKSLDYSRKSLSYSFSNFSEFLKNPNSENTYKMCLAANLSGKAISISRTTAPHALSYPFTSFFNISHGHAVSLTLNKFILFNYKNANKVKNNFDLKKRYKMLFELSKTNSISDFCNYLNALKKEAKLEGSLKKLNINLDTNYEKIISGVNPERLKNNPIEINQNDIKSILGSIN